MRPALSGTAAIRNGGTESRNQVLSWASLSLPVSVCRPQALSPQAAVPRYGCWLLAAGCWRRMGRPFGHLGGVYAVPTQRAASALRPLQSLRRLGHPVR
jgi:hypothetical protein